MTGMTAKGIHVRGTDVRAAANRLRWEVDFALGVWPTHPATMHGQLDAVSVLDEIAETVAILRRIVITIGEQTPEPLRSGILDGRLIEERFAGLLEYHSGRHETPR